MVPFDRFAVVLDAFTMFPMLVRDVLLTLAANEFFSPKCSPRIRDEWTRNLIARMSERDSACLASRRRCTQERIIAKRSRRGVGEMVCVSRREKVRKIVQLSDPQLGALSMARSILGQVHQLPKSGGVLPNMGKKELTIRRRRAASLADALFSTV